MVEASAGQDATPQSGYNLLHYHALQCTAGFPLSPDAIQGDVESCMRQVGRCVQGSLTDTWAPEYWVFSCHGTKTFRYHFLWFGFCKSKQKDFY
ncbi:hypothetical protein E2C01_099385 [Portunus trituberculatus]|uniref:Uncharacterized protein n=1 Tax=Portunus trituberculatus TaxID=210409 RepID=A0A5B7KGQ8_PORTR|nr:hypothetical protein [Portunus trituberculatus]